MNVPLGYRFFQSAAALIVVVGMLAGAQAQARMLKLEKLSPQKVEHLSKDAKKDYQVAADALDRILYEKALAHLLRAVEKDKDNIDLRLMVVQLATYLGDTRNGSKSIQFYDHAVINLKEMVNSPQLNLREQKRARKALEKIGALQRTVIERDEKRREFGMEIAKQYLEEFGGEEDEEKEKSKQELKDRRELTEILAGADQPAGVE